MERLWGKRPAAVLQGGYRWQRRLQKDSPEACNDMIGIGGTDLSPVRFGDFAVCWVA
ncbi:hypothetical protein USDA257_c37330 [Sinorhizobium fredii USDA 257]|uniref:Uncharacterized protein n=1 Tax=Sinorhizobium fredii (strain USDA 257) TaxID=1185652 RepID=I3X8S6_SINF2|nr:hypothetical protein USDA257_c37330 [Sinorhizobium fredii USDA 257]